MKFSIKDFLSKCDTTDLDTFTEEIVNGKLHSLCTEVQRREKSVTFQTRN